MNPRGRDLTPAERQRVGKLAQRSVDAEARAGDARRRRDEVIAELLDAGASPTRLGIAVDLSGEAVRIAARRVKRGEDR
jgi:hypothetical protein